MFEHRGREYEVIRSSRKTLSLIQNRDGKFIIRCPTDTSDTELEALLERKLEWIERKSIEWEEIQQNRKDSDDGLSIKYLGRRSRLHESTSSEEIEFVNGRIQVPNGYSGLGKGVRRRMIRAFLIKRGNSIMPRMVRASSTSLGIPVPDTKIMDLGFRWGSCSNKDRVNFHWKCLTLPSRVVRYIVTHELAHLIVPDHSKLFWRTLEEASPDFEAHEEWLRSNGINFDLY